jgi:hypothetical protein
MSDIKIYLAKAGRISGPYTDHDLKGMEANGQLEYFTWVWKSTEPGWQTLDPIPAPLDPSNLPDNLPKEAPPLPKCAPPVPPQARNLKLVDAIEGICHDYRNVVAGKVVHATDTWCELLVDTHDAATPVFGGQAKVFLNLLNSKNGQTIDVQAQLSKVTRTREGTTYRLEWVSSVPAELLRASG